MALTYQSPEGNPGVGPLSTTLTSVYTVPTGGTATVGSIYFTNIHATNSATCFAYVRKSGRSYDICVCNGVNLAVGVTYNAIEGGPIVLQAGDILKVKAGAASSIDCFISLQEKT